jgi:two-component system CheB/CheR fusion protein
LTDLVSRLAYPDLMDDIRAVSASHAAVERSVSLADATGHYLARILPYRDSAHRISGIIVTFVDISSIVAAEAQQKVLAAELSHRVRNTLAVVSSIAERTLPQGETTESLIGRLHALAHTHEMLSRTDWSEAALRELVLVELAPHAGDNVHIAGPTIMLRPRSALFLSLAIHELSTNAAKYGALSVPGGRVEVTWRVNRDQSPCLEITWAESGGPHVDSLLRRGFGTELIERGVRYELHGEARLEPVDGSVRCIIMIPASPENMTPESLPGLAHPGLPQIADAAP